MEQMVTHALFKPYIFITQIGLISGAALYSTIVQYYMYYYNTM